MAIKLRHPGDQEPDDTELQMDAEIPAPMIEPDLPAIPRRRIDASRGNPLSFTGDMAKHFSGEVNAAHRATREQDALDLGAMRLKARRTEAEKARQQKESAAAERQAKKDQNAAIEADFRTRGVQFFTDANGNIQPVTDDAGRITYSPKTGETQWDEQGNAFRVDRTETNPKKRVDLDAGAQVGPHDGDMGRLYKQNKLSPWQQVATVDEALNSPDATIRTAAQKARDDADKRQIAEARRAFAQGRNKVSAEEFDARQKWQQAQGEIQALSVSMEAIRQNPQYNKKTGGGIFGLGAAETAESVALKEQERKINDRINALNAGLMAFDERAFADRRETATREMEAFDYATSQSGIEGAAAERASRLLASGADPDKDPVIAGINKARKEMGLKPLDLEQTAKRQQQAAEEAQLRADPVFGGVMQKRDEVSAANQADAERVQQAAQGARAALDPERQQIDEARAQQDEITSQLEAAEQRLAAALPGAGSIEERIAAASDTTAARIRPLIERVSQLRAQAAQGGARLNPMISAFNERAQAAQAEIEGAAADAEQAASEREDELYLQAEAAREMKQIEAEARQKKARKAFDEQLPELIETRKTARRPIVIPAAGEGQQVTDSDAAEYARAEAEQGRATKDLQQQKKAFMEATGLDERQVENILDDQDTIENLKPGTAARLKHSGKVIVSPELAADEKAWKQAVEATGASAEEKRLAIEHRKKALEEIAPVLRDELLNEKDWQKFIATDEAKKMSPGEQVEAYYAKHRGKLNAISAAAKQALASIGKTTWGAIAGATGNEFATEAMEAATYQTQRFGALRERLGGAGATGYVLDIAASLAPSLAMGGVGRAAGSIAGAATAGRVASGAMTAERAAQIASRAAKATMAAGIAGQSYGGVFSDAYAENLKKGGMTTEQARSDAQAPAIMGGLVTYALSRVFGRGVEQSAQKLPEAVKVAATETGRKRLAQAIRVYAGERAKDFTDEAIEEALDQASQGIIETLTYNPDKDPLEIAKEALEAGLMGGVGGAVIGGAAARHQGHYEMKSRRDQMSKFNAKAEEARQSQPSELFEALGAFSDASETAKAFGAEDADSLRTGLEQIDEKIDRIRGQGQKSTKLADQTAHAEELAAAYEERRQWMERARERTRLEEAAEEIDSLEIPDASEKQIKDTKIAAKALVKIARGVSMDALTAAERAALEADSPDGLPRVEMLAGPDGVEKPVITDGAIKRLRTIAPAAAELIGKTEAERRKEIISASPAGSPSEPAAAEPAGQEPQQPAKTEGDQGSASRTLTPMRSLSKAENGRVNALRRMLTNVGVSDDLAERVARGYVSENGSEGAPAEHRAKVMASLAAAGGVTYDTEPDAMRRREKNREAMRAFDAQDEAQAAPEIDRVTDDFVAKMEEAMQIGDAKDENGQPLKGTMLTPKARERLKPFARALSRYFQGLPVKFEARGAVEAGVSSDASGGAWMKDGAMVVSVADIIARRNLSDLSDPQRARLIAQEEAIHILADNLLGKDAIRALWAKISKEAPQFAALVENTYQSKNAYVLGHEMIRYRAQWLLNKRVTEQLSPGIVAAVRQFLGKLLAKVRSLVSSLRAEGASEETINELEGIAQEIAKRIREFVADARRLSPYLVNNEQGTEITGGQRSGSASPKADALQPGGSGVAQQGEAGGGVSRAGKAGGATDGGRPADDTEKELARLRAALDERAAKDERAAQRRKGVVAQAQRLGDFEAVIQSAPEDAREQVKAILDGTAKGEASYVVGVNGDRLPAIYIATPLDAVQPSHLPRQGFAKNPAYLGENTRKYHSDPKEQEKVIEASKPGQYNPDLEVTDTKGAESGPIMSALVIDAGEDGKPRVSLQAAGGNGRLMMKQAGTDEDANAVADEWARKADRFGFQQLPDGWHGTRFLGVFDLRVPAQAARYRQIVDALNPTPGMSASASDRAELDAGKIPAGTLAGLTLDLSATQAQAKIMEMLRDADALGLEKTVIKGIAADLPNAQFYMRKLLLASAFRSPALSRFYFDAAGFTGKATVEGLIKHAAAAALELREKGADEIADSIARTLESVADYVRNGDTIARALGRAAEQVEMGPESEAVRALADALRGKVQFREQNARGNRPVDAEPTIEGFADLFEDVTRAVRVFDATPDMFGVADTMAQTVRRALAAHARKTDQLPIGTESVVPAAKGSPNDSRRLRALLRQQREEGLNRWEQAELDMLEKRAGQDFMPFFEATRQDPQFSLEQEAAPAARASEQMALLSKAAPLDPRIAKEGRSPVFFSGLTKTISALPQDTLTVQQARALIEKGAKKDEIAQQGLFTDPLSPLAGKQPGDKVTKKELLDYSTERAARVEDVVLGNDDGMVFKEGYSTLEELMDAVRDDSEIIAKDGGLQRGLEAVETHSGWNIIDSKSVGGGTHFSNYQLPGADEGTYREMFVTWPGGNEANKAHESERFAFHKEMREKYGIDGFYPKLNEAEREKYNSFDISKRSTWNDGHSQYSDITNPIVRIRRNLRTLPDGRRAYFIEEIQGPSSSEQAKMPEFLRKRIYEIGMKRALRDAADEGADVLAWTTGEQQAERYDLSKQVDKIEWSTDPGFLKVVSIKLKDGGWKDVSVQNGKVYRTASVAAWRGKPLEEIVGKEIAAKINAEGKGEINQDGLNIGGEGLKSLYDRTLLSIANDLAKKAKADARVGTVMLQTGREKPKYGVNGPSVVRFTENDGMELVSMQDNTPAARREANRLNAEAGIGTSVHALPIPEALRTHAERGQALLSKAASPAQTLRNRLAEIADQAESELPDEWLAIADGDRKYPGLPGFAPSPGLSRDEILVEAHFAWMIARDTDAAAARYRELSEQEFPGAAYAGADLARMLYPEYAQSKRMRLALDRATLAPAGWVALGKIRREAMQDNTRETVVLLAGGMASGKTTAAQTVVPGAEQGVVIDRVFFGKGSISNAINSAIEAGKKAVAYFVFRPFENAAEGAILRTIKSGRPVNDIGTAHYGAQMEFLRAAEEYGDRIPFAVILNDKGLTEIREASVDALRRRSYGELGDETRKQRAETRRETQEPRGVRESSRAGQGVQAASERVGQEEPRQDAEGLVRPPTFPELTGTDAERIAALNSYYLEAVASARDHGVRVKDSSGSMYVHRLDDAEYLALTKGHIGEDESPLAKARRDTGTLDFFSGNALTPAEAPRKEPAKPATPNANTGPRRNNDAPRISDGGNELPGLFGDSGRPAAPPRVDQGQLDFAAGGNETARPGGSGGGGTGGGIGGRGGAGNGALGADQAGAAQGDQGGLPGPVRPGGRGDTADESRLNRPPEGSPQRNAKIDPSRSYAPRQGRARFEANIRAIQLMRQLEDEGRNATVEEKEELLAYTGWGWMKEAFNKVRAAKYGQSMKELRAEYDRQKQRYEESKSRYSRYYTPSDPGTWENFRDQYLRDDDDENEGKLRSWAENYLPYYERLRAELTEEEFDSAAKSVRNAHYTDVPVIGKMWDLVEKLGFKGGRATEPSAGIGHFIGAMPDRLADRTAWNAVELDEVTARILAHLYPEVNVNGAAPQDGRKVRGQGFQEARIPNNSQDLVISNVPFAKEGPGASEKEFGTKFNLHNYFFARAFAKARPGGLVVFITSNSTMDANLEQRQALAAMGELVGAIRLPNNAFKANAGTEVTTDILVFRKPDGTAPRFDPQSWSFTREVNRVQMATDRPRNMDIREWLKQQPPEWVPEDPDVAAAFAEWKNAGFPETGKRIGALREAVRAANQDSTMRWIAPVVANEYWLSHPEHALGRHSLEGSMYKQDSYALVPGTEDLQSAMQRAIDTFPSNIIGEGSTGPQPDRQTAGEGDRVGAFVERDGKIYSVEPDGLAEAEWSLEQPGEDKRKRNAREKRIAMFRSWAKIRSAYSTLIDLELHGGSESDVEDARAALNRAYDRHVAEYENLAKPSRNPLKFLEDDPEFIPLQALEVVTKDVDERGKEIYRYRKADIFTRRAIREVKSPTKADTLEDAVLFTMSKNGFLHIPSVAELLGIPEPEAHARLIDSGYAFIEPASGLLVSADEYLSGHVRKKLDAAIEAARQEPRYRANVEALTKALPPDQSIATIFPNMRAAWLPVEVIQAFAEKVLGLQRVEISRAAGKTFLAGVTGPQTDDRFQTPDAPASRILKDILADEKTVIKESVRQADGSRKTVIRTEATNAAKIARENIEAAFIEFAKTSQEKLTVAEEEKTVPEHIEAAFNKNVGGWVPPTFRGDWITLPGQSGEIYLDRGFRKSVLARLLTAGYGMIAHGVGSGKTLTQIALVMEMRRLGKAKKPVIVVEKSTIGQFASAFRRAYPQAKLLVAGDNNFGRQDRARFLGMMQSGDWDAIIMTRPQVTKIPHEGNALRDYLARQLATLDAALLSAEDGSDAQGHIQSLRDKLEERIRKMASELAENQDLSGVTWEKLGVDALVVDEAHNFKNTFVYTEKENVKNLPSGQFAQQAISMELKTASVRQRKNGRGVFFATGTPVSNAMHEAWVMMNYIAPHVLEQNGVSTFDQFADTYGDTKTGPEANWNGEVKDVTRFAKFVNGQALINLIRSVFDVAMGNAKLGLDVPPIKGGKPNLMILDETPPMNAVNDWVVNTVAEQWTATFGEKDENGAYITPPMQGLRDYIEENPWVTAVPIMTMQAGIAAALDPRLLHDNAPDDPGSKVNTAVRMILERYHKPHARENKTAQVIFTDLRNPFKTDLLEEFTGSNPFEHLGPNPREFDLYEDIAKKLVAGGIPREQIGWLEGQMDDDKKEAFFEKVNNGDIRVVIGGTKISTGVNFQQRLAAAYHLMPPRDFKPAQMEQRNGRIIRQGNLHAEWAHNAFVAEAEKAARKTFQGDSPMKRRKAAETWLESNDPSKTVAQKAKESEQQFAIEIFELGMGKSLDSAIYSMMAAKQGFIAQVLSGNAGAEFEDPTDEVMMSMAEMAAHTIGDPRLIRKIELERALKRVAAERDAWMQRRGGYIRQIRSLTATIPSAEASLKADTAAAERLDGMFTKRNDGEGKQIEPLYEFGSGAKFDAAAKAAKGEGLLTSINRYFMDMWANRRGDAISVRGKITINGVPVTVEIDDPLEGAGEDGMAGRFDIGDGREIGFRGAQSFLAKLRKVVEELPRTLEGRRMSLEQSRAQLAKAQESYAGFPAKFDKQAEYDSMVAEIARIRGYITAAKRNRGKATAQPDESALDAMRNEGGPLSKAAPDPLVVGQIEAVDRIASRYGNAPGSDPEERRSIARAALMRAAQNYDPTKGDFANYAQAAARNALRDHFRRQVRNTGREAMSLDEQIGDDEATGHDLFAGDADVARAAQNDDAAALIRRAIAELPDSLREVVEGIAKGESYAEIGARTGGYTKQGIARRAGVALDRLRQKLAQSGVRGTDDLFSPSAKGAPRDYSPEEEIKMLVRMARSEKAGKRTIGRPDLALGAEDPILMGVDEWRKSLKPQSHEQWEREAANVSRAQITKAFDAGDQLKAAEVKAAMRFVIEDVRQAAASPGDDALQLRVQQLVNSYRQARAEQARGLAAGRDPFKTPAERHREFLARVIFTAPEDVQKKINEAKTPDERKKLLTEDQKRIARIRKALEDMGVTFEDLFSGEVELRLKAKKIAQAELEAAKGRDADVLKMFMERRNFAAVAAEMKVSEADVRRVVKEAAERVKQRHFAKFEKGATAANVGAAPMAKAADADAEFAKFLDVLGLTEETPTQAKKRVARKTKGRPFDINDPVAVVRIARTIQALDSSLVDKAMELWINNILSGPATHVANIAGNALNSAWNLSVERGAEALANLVIRDPRAAQLGEFRHMLRGVLPGIAKGWSLAAMAWTAEYDFTDHALLGAPVDLQQIAGKVSGRGAIRGPMGRIVRIPGRALMWADSLFKGIIGTMEAGAHAYRIAKAEGLEGDALEKRTRELVSQPGSPAWVSAVESAKANTFQQDLRGLGETINPLEIAASAVQDASQRSPLLRFVVPFIRTPFNILRAGVRKTPLGSLSLALDAALAGHRWIARMRNGQIEANPALPADFVKHFAEQAIAWGVMSALWDALPGDDDDETKPILLTGSSPRREATSGERALQERAYGGDYVLRVGGMKFHYGRYEPFATVLGTLADSARVLKSPRTPGDKVDALWHYFVAQAESKSFLKGISDMISAVSDAKGARDKLATTFAQALVPNLIRQPLRNLDEYRRDARGGGATYSALPMASGAEPKIDVWGQPVKKGGSAVARLAVTTPTETQPLRQADAMLLNWNRKNPADAWAPSPPQRTYKDPKTGREVEMTAEQFRRYSELSGKRAAALLAGRITSPAVTNPKEKDVDAVKAAFEKARRETRDQLFGRRRLTPDMIWK